MKIMHIVNSFAMGGAEKLIVDIIENYSYDDELYLCVINDKLNNKFICRVQQCINDRVYLMNKREGKSNISLYIFKVFFWVKKNNIKIVHIHNTSIIKFVFLVRLFSPRTKFIYTVHDTNKIKKHNKYKNMFYKWVVNHFIAISEAVKNDLILAGIASQKITKIYNGIVIEEYKSTRKNTFQYPIKLCCVARIMPEKKGQDVLIKALGILKKRNYDFKCYFIGEDISKKGKVKKGNSLYLKELANECNVLKDITFMGNKDNVPEILEKMNIMILPSRYEGFGLVIVEGLAAKCIVIASDIDGPKEIIKNNVTGYLFESENYLELAERIIQVINLKNKDKLMSTALKDITLRFDIDRLIKEYHKIYEKTSQK